VSGSRYTVRRRSGEEREQQRAVLLGEIEQARDEVAHDVLDRRLVDLALQRLELPVHLVSLDQLQERSENGGIEQLCLGSEVVEQERFGRAGAPADPTRRGRVVAVGQKQLVRGVEKRLPHRCRRPALPSFTHGHSVVAVTSGTASKGPRRS
jgi:hypothetical protein